MRQRLQRKTLCVSGAPAIDLDADQQVVVDLRQLHNPPLQRIVELQVGSITSPRNVPCFLCSPSLSLDPKKGERALEKPLGPLVLGSLNDLANAESLIEAIQKGMASDSSF